MFVEFHAELNDFNVRMGGWTIEGAQTLVRRYGYIYIYMYNASVTSR